MRALNIDAVFHISFSSASAQSPGITLFLVGLIGRTPGAARLFARLSGSIDVGASPSRMCFVCTQVTHHHNSHRGSQNVKQSFPKQRRPAGVSRKCRPLQGTVIAWAIKTLVYLLLCVQLLVSLMSVVSACRTMISVWGKKWQNQSLCVFCFKSAFEVGPV